VPNWNKEILNPNESRFGLQEISTFSGKNSWKSEDE
jgi:hypothetical protein